MKHQNGSNRDQTKPQSEKRFEYWLSLYEKKLIKSTRSYHDNKQSYKIYMIHFCQFKFYFAKEFFFVISDFFKLREITHQCNIKISQKTLLQYS